MILSVKSLKHYIKRVTGHIFKEGSEEMCQGKNSPHNQKYLFIKLTERNDTGGNKLTQQVNKRLMHFNTVKIV